MRHELSIASAGSILLSVMTATLLLDTASADIHAPNTNTILNFTFRVDHMPDLDQIKGNCVNGAGFPSCVLPPPQGCSGAPCLSNAGLMYCAPTSGVNLVTYLAHHGFPELLGGNGLPNGFEPNHGNWQAWKQPSHYFAATWNQALMGQYMATHPVGGTSPYNMYAGMRNALGPRFAVAGGTPWGNLSPNFYTLLPLLAQRYVVIFSYAYYQQVGVYQGLRVLSLDGGHVVSLTKLSGGLNTLQVKVRDPADNGVPPTTLNTVSTQSNFRDRSFNIIGEWVIVINEFGQPPLLRFVHRLVPLDPAPGNNPNVYLAFHTFVAARPRAMWTLRNVEGQLKLVRIDPVGWAPNEQQEFPAPGDIAVIDAVAIRGGGNVLVLTEGEGGGHPRVWMLNPDFGGGRLIAEIPGGQRLLAGRNRQVYVLAGNKLTRINFDRPNENQPDVDPPPGGGMLAGETTEIDLPFTPQAMDYDEVSDEIVMLAIADGRLLRCAADFSGEIDNAPLPKEISSAAGGDVAVNPADGSVWIISHNADAVYGLSGGKEGYEVSETIEVDGVSSPRSIQFDDAGHIWLAAGGVPVELEPGGKKGEWTLVRDSPFSRFEVGDRFSLTRSSTNSISGVHDDPDQWSNIDPPDLVPGEPVPLCFADLNDDGVVDAIDLLILLDTWGPWDLHRSTLPDLNNDFAVDVRDLLLLLSAWGECDDE